MRNIFTFFIINVLFVINISCVGNFKNNIINKNRNYEVDFLNYIEDCVRQAWDVSWERFYHSKTNLFYDYLTIYESGKELSHLPTVNEVARLYPNINGYDTGMEDCMISAGIMLSMLIDQYAVTTNEKLRELAYSVFKGIQLCATVHGVPGFLARGVCVEDGKSIYICSSRDQYTHAVHGLWYYFHSPLSSPETKIEISKILVAFADRAIQNVIPENDYNFLRADGKPDNLLKMWDNDGHEAARLPMIFAAAWDVTGELKYFNQYQKYLEQSIDKSFIDFSKVNSWSLLQMQSSLDLLLTLEKDPKLKKQMSELMHMVSKEAGTRAINANENSMKYNLTLVASDWREGGGIKWGSEYRNAWYSVRESGEAALTQLLNEYRPFSEKQEMLLFQAITKLDYNRVSTSGIFYLQGAYWRMQKRKIL